MISKIWASNLDEQGYTSDKTVNGKPCLEVSKINLFIGANNSGKSRLIRIIFNEKSSFYIEKSGFLTQYEKLIEPLKNLECIENKDLLLKPITESFTYTDQHQKNISHFFDEAESIRRLPIPKQIDNDTLYKLAYDLKELTTTDNSPLIIPDKYYIPTLRGMRPLVIASDDKINDKSDLLKKRTMSDYFLDSEYYQNNILTGYDFYERLRNFLLGQPEERELIRKYEKILSDDFFNGQVVTLIPEVKRDVVSIKIGDEKQLPIFDLGDGLQQIIIITSAAYLISKSSMFFIEEPETNLHPGLLRKLIEFLIKYTRHQYFFTTHSNHLLDLYNNYDFVTLHKVNKKINQSGVSFEVTDCTNDKTILSDLGVSPSSVYLSNSTIWVEGITDRLYLRCFMRKYTESQCDTEKLRLQRYLENYHYSFVEYQGGTLGHWNFDDDDVDGGNVGGLCAVKLCANAFLIADGDIKSKGNRLDTLMSQLGDKLYVTKGKELENMLPDVIVKKVAGEIFENSRKEKESLNKNSIESLAFENYSVSDEGIGFHLDKCFGLQGKGKESKRFFAEESGTIRNKVHFCNLAVKYMISNEIEWDLTNDLRDLCKKIFNHIESCNYL